MRPTQQAQKLLVALRKRHFPHCKNTFDVVQKLWGFYQEQTSKAEPTQDLNLQTTTACPVRFQNQDAFFCGYGIPSRKPRKLITLKECEVCKAMNKDKLTKIAVQRADLNLKDVRGRGQGAKVDNLQAYAKQLEDGTHLKHCPIVGQGFKLMDLPCVVQSDKFRNDYGCRHKDCEAQVRQYVKVLYLEV